MRLSEDFAWSLDILLPIEPFEFKIVVCDPDSDSVKWEVEGLHENRTVEVNPDSGTHLVSVILCEPDPVDFKIKVTCKFGDVKKTELALMVPGLDMRAAVATAAIRVHKESDFVDRLEDEIALGLHEKPEWEVRALELAEVAATTPSMFSSMQALAEEAYKAGDLWVSVPIGRVHVPPGASVAAVRRLADASFLPLEEAQAKLAPPQSALSWLAAQRAPETVGASQ